MVRGQRQGSLMAEKMGTIKREISANGRKFFFIFSSLWKQALELESVPEIRFLLGKTRQIWP
jgi:hypothetical protein